MGPWIRLVQRAAWESAHWGHPTFAWGLHWSSDARLWSLPELCCSYACAWPRASPIRTLTHRLNFLFWPQTYLVSMDLPCHHGLTRQSLQYWLILVIVTSPALCLHEAPLLMRLVPLCALLSPAFEEKPTPAAPWQMRPQVFWKLCLTKQYYRVLKSWSFNRNRCWLCTLYHKISSKVWFTIVALIFCANQETFLNKPVILQNASSGRYVVMSLFKCDSSLTELIVISV